jgi:hypothetical protein
MMYCGGNGARKRFREERRSERRSLSNPEWMSAKADKGDKSERRSLSDPEWVSAKTDKGDKSERRSLSKYGMGVRQGGQGG